MSAIDTVATSGIQAPRSHLGLERARLAAEMGKWRTAVALLAPRLEEPGEDPEVLGLYGWCLARAGGDLERARDACRRAVDMQPYVARQHARLGSVYLCAKLERHAVDCFQAALQLDPEETLAREGLQTLAGAASSSRWRAWLRSQRRSLSSPDPA